MGATTTRLDEVDHGAGVIAPVRDQGPGGFRAVDQRLQGGLVRRVAGGEYDPQRQAILINKGIDLGAQSSTKTADGVIRAPFFPPAAYWWPRTIELSIRCIDPGDPAARVSNTLSQTPAFDHLL